MKIGVTGRGGPKAEEHTLLAESLGFSTLWFNQPPGSDPLLSMALAGRATTRIEIGSAVLQTYPTHPLLLGARLRAVADVMGRPGLAVGIGPSHREFVEQGLGIEYRKPVQHTRDFLAILSELARTGAVQHTGEALSADLTEPAMKPFDLTLLVAAIRPQMLRMTAVSASGTILWLANERAIGSTIKPTLDKAANESGRLEPPRVVAGLPVAVHHDRDEALAAIEAMFGRYCDAPSYRYTFEIGGVRGLHDVAAAGDASSVKARLGSLIEAGATEVWAFVVPVGDQRADSVRRTHDVLASLVGS